MFAASLRRKIVQGVCGKIINMVTQKPRRMLSIINLHCTQ